MRLLFALLISTSHAGWWSDFCSRHLMANDPYQFETASTEWLRQAIDRLEIKERWGKIEPEDQWYLDTMRRTLKEREGHGA